MSVTEGVWLYCAETVTEGAGGGEQVGYNKLCCLRQRKVQSGGASSPSGPLSAHRC